ncbi:RagB/SusD family nutrient uptake outer membrane protein [Hymenobacter sp. GOD-10R]|uniref:RagB/SusD family nutrient uptake outer membrane protein n=1 Tax=Hymenobacter sp. GOD-10R TaxID=3093922 RepID=UPI002D788971|nr:RagB/SusD family nutrient uptake outer membrane protein [Hymenobacter sp. GOD-10R]WRQ26604.1 RagB/SusD family nutrient uptake outer membrane protein [Hymenobacter sp. GOD-10R]
MKNKALLLISGLLALFTSSCELDVPVESQFVESNFPKTLSDYNASVGAIYANLSSSYAVPYWRMQEMSTDAAIIPARDGNFDDGGQYRQLHYHTWTPDHPNVLGIWQWAYSGILTCNRLLPITNNFGFNATELNTKLAEIRAMRALYYFFLMDLYGNVPIVTEYPVNDPPATQPRSEVYKFIETELLDVVKQLPAKTNSLSTNTQQYGRPTKGMVFALLAKMYLNSEVYVGTPRYPDVVRMADSVQTNRNYSLDAKYRDIFLPNNGPQINETIFAIPYDQQIPGNQFTRFGFFYYLTQAYGFNVGLSIAMSTTPEFYNRFNLLGDFRTKTWLAGPQFVPDGNGGFTNTPVYYPGTTTQIVIDPVLTLVPPKPMDLGNTLTSQSEGVRSIKYYPDPTIIQATRLNSNDVPVFRLADVMLMKAEAILRGASATSINGELQTPLVLVNKIRARSGAQTAGSITLNGIPDERARELYWEGWRRNDLIRFGQFEVEYPLPNDNLKMDKSTFRRLYPVPTNELKLNPNLKQNEGY